MRTDSGMLIPLQVRPARLWAALSDPSRLWSVLAPDACGPPPVDGVMGRTLTFGDADRPWRYLMRVLDRDDDTRTVHVEVRTHPLGGVGTTRILGTVRIRPHGRHSTLVLTWRVSSGTESPQDAGEVLRAVREEVTELLPPAARRGAGLGLPAAGGSAGRGRLLAAGAGAAAALLVAVLVTRRLRGGRR